jgi:hypothetical protein
MRGRGGYIGFNRVPAASAYNSAASGVWTLREAESLQRQSTWPLTTPLLLDNFPSAAAAYSLRQLRAGASAPVVRVRRSSDSEESDFSSSQITDGSLAAWVGAGNDGFVATWYDQSGNGVHASNTTSNSQPMLVSGGGLVQRNSKPAVNFARNVTLPTCLSATLNSNNQNWTVASVCTIQSSRPAGHSFDYGRVLSVGNFNGEDFNNQFSFVMSLNFQAISSVSAPNTLLGYAGAFAVVSLPAYDAQYIFCGYKSGSTVSCRVNNGNAVSVTQSGTLSAGRLRLGASINYGIGESNSVLWGTIQEVIYYQTDRSSDVAGLIAEQNSYYNTF